MAQMSAASPKATGRAPGRRPGRAVYGRGRGRGAHAQDAYGHGGAPQLPAGRRASAAPVRRGLPTAAWLLPLLVGLAYGLWAAQMDRAGPPGHTRYAGPITTGNVLLGVLSGLVVALLAFLLHRIAHRLPPEARAVAWGAYTGLALGWLYSLSHASVFRTVVIGLVSAVAVAATTYYRYHTYVHPAGRP